MLLGKISCDGQDIILLGKISWWWARYHAGGQDIMLVDKILCWARYHAGGQDNIMLCKI